VSDSESHPRSESSIGGVSVASLTRVFATIVEQSQDAILVCDEQGTITPASPDTSCCEPLDARVA